MFLVAFFRCFYDLKKINNEQSFITYLFYFWDPNKKIDSSLSGEDDESLLKSAKSN